MKTKIILLVILLASLASNVNSQSVYHMSAYGGGTGEYISNLKTTSEYWGMQFGSGNYCRGFVNNNGVWGMVSRFRSSSVESLNRFNKNLNDIMLATLGVDGEVAADGFRLTKLDESTKTYMTIGLTDLNVPLIYSYDNYMFIGGKKGFSIYTSKDPFTNTAADFDFTTESAVFKHPLYVNRSDGSFIINTDADGTDYWVGSTSNHGLYLGTNNGSTFYVDTKQKVYIGLPKASRGKIREELRNKYFLFVNKGILSEDFAIAPVSSWSDFVFNKDYNLRAIEEVESFIEENNHLPDVPSAADVAEEGYSQHDMNKVLLQKIEELTLYTIQQQKEIKALKSELNELKK